VGTSWIDLISGKYSDTRWTVGAQRSKGTAEHGGESAGAPAERESTGVLYELLPAACPHNPPCLADIEEREAQVVQT
jgi:hypothetical protein